ncbi:P-loop NTPase fold protein [Paenibacillus sp. 37]|uniref:P-loop NTPase fold protein n=1 Tax=Paenibacillus sp. 37 TaxID=2607911 RepID=UPI00122E87AC|nr:P-loop NTPase fold protein [Paenibacillus sp. 37]
MLPCLNRDTLKLLVGTADERYNYSPHYFRKTHFPQVMHRYHGNQLLAEITENELYEDLVETDSEGNRVFLLFGSTGSGKSELLCWIKDKWLNNEVNRPVIRISRTELNPQVLIKKCFEALNIPLQIRIDESRWELLLKKPITLINQIVWGALSEILPTDEEIVPTALMIRPIIERNITEFTLQVQNGRIKKPLEVIHQSQFDELLSTTTIQIPIEYPSFRKLLSQKLDQFLFEGRDIDSLFKQLSESLKTMNVRPLLLIDDLVQSVNIYASDLLDQLITLEEGNWDVVIGLTPGAMQGNDKGLDLTQRIQNLDTITDRVKKLWLSDESGKDFYNLDRDQVTTYMSNYLVELKRSQGFTCSKECPHYEECNEMACSFGGTTEDLIEQDINLLPFNRHMVKRTFDAIPIGKGKLRYMILNSKEIIRFFIKGKRELVTRVLPIVKRDRFSDHPDLFIKTYAECYGSDKQENCLIPKKVLHYFGYQDDEIPVRLYPLDIDDRVEASIAKIDNYQKTDPDKSTIREWAEGKQINVELLEPVRLGVSTLIHDVIKGVNISRPFTPRMSATIQRKNVVNRTRYPVSLDKNERDPKKVGINRGYASLQISNFQLLKSSEKARTFHQIANEYETASWIYQTEELADTWVDELKEALGMPIELFVYHLKNWITQFSVLENAHWTADIKNQSPVNHEMTNLIEQTYQDWYLLRDNMNKPVDLEDIQRIDFDSWMKSYTPVRDLENYQIGEASLYVFLLHLKTKYKLYLELSSDLLLQQIKTRQEMVPFLLESINPMYHAYANKIMDFEKKSLYTFNDHLEYLAFEEHLEEENILTEFITCNSSYQEVIQLFERFQLLCEAIQHQMGEFEDIQVENPSIYKPNWSNLHTEKEKLLEGIADLTLLNECLATSANAWEQVLRSKSTTAEVLLVKNLWSRFVESTRCLMKMKLNNSNLKNDIDKWKSIDFYQLRGHVEKLELRDRERLNLVYHMQIDLGCGHDENLDKLIELIEMKKELRPAIKRHLITLLEEGYTTLPPVQWRRLVDELKEKFPKLFAVVEIQLVSSSK